MTDVPGPLASALHDRYRLERKLGVGGMATVYLAQDLRHDRPVAVKVLRPELAAMLGGERFVQEIKTTANLQHPHILPLHDSGAAGGFLFYVMPYVEGESLRTRLQREKQLPVGVAVRIAAEVASALDYAHRHGVIHRDIKPENILLHEEQALVADFGIALAVSAAGGGRLTETGLSLGTPHYMSPEQAMGERELTARSDVYALGCVLYEMLLGDPPFTGATAQIIVGKLMTEAPRPLRAGRSSVPEAVEDAVLTALEKLPADRFGSAAEFAAALADGTTERRRDGRTHHRAPSAVPSFRLSSLAVVSGLLVLSTALALWGWLRPRSEAAPAAVRFQFGPDSSHTIALSCCGAQLAVAANERRLYYIGLELGVRRVFARSLDSLAALAVAGTDGAQEIFLSPDGAWIGFRIPKGSATPSSDLYEIRKVPTAGGVATTVASLTGWPYGAAWLDDGTLVLAAESRLYRVSASGGDPVPLGFPDSAYTNPGYLPGSGRVLATNRRTGRVQVIGLSGGAPRDIGDGLRGLYTDGHLILITTGEGRSIMAQAFDPRTARLEGMPVTIAVDLSRSIDLAVGPGGMLFYAVGRAGAVIESVTRDGVAQSALGSEENATHFDNPRFSPDGTHLAAAAGFAVSGKQVGRLVLGHQIVVFDLARRTSLRLTFEGWNEFLDWSPDGRSIIYTARDSAIAIQPADRSGPERILTVPGLGSLGRVTAGGRWVAFAVINSKANPVSSDIMIAPLDSMATPRPYQAAPFDEFAPALSPDGRWLAWVSNESGRNEVYASTAPMPAAREAISAGGGAEPVWSRDGKALYYRTADGQLMAVSLRTGARLEIVERKPLFRRDYEISADGAAGYDVHPSGQRFAMMRRLSLDTRLVVVTEALRAARSPERR